MIPEEHLRNVCRLGAGEACCAFLASRQGFECAKGIPEIAQQIRVRLIAGSMNAKGDNCSGPPDYVPFEKVVAP